MRFVTVVKDEFQQAEHYSFIYVSVLRCCHLLFFKFSKLHTKVQIWKRAPDLCRIFALRQERHLNPFLLHLYHSFTLVLWHNLKVRRITRVKLTSLDMKLLLKRPVMSNNVRFQVPPLRNSYLNLLFLKEFFKCSKQVFQHLSLGVKMSSSASLIITLSQERLCGACMHTCALWRGATQRVSCRWKVEGCSAGF